MSCAYIVSMEVKPGVITMAFVKTDVLVDGLAINVMVCILICIFS